MGCCGSEELEKIDVPLTELADAVRRAAEVTGLRPRGALCDCDVDPAKRGVDGGFIVGQTF